MALSIYCERFNLNIKYQNYNNIENLGIKLFIGKKIFRKTLKITDGNYFKYYRNKNTNFNVQSFGFFQTKKITDLIHKYLLSDKIMNNIISKNKYKIRYNNNNDCFIHVRLGSVKKFNPGFDYYNNIISNIKFNNLYLSSDEINHEIIKKIKKNYPKIIIMNTNNLDEIILFASTCKHIILSYGTFSAIIGYLSFYSNVHCLKFCKEYAWDWNHKGEFDMFRNKYTKINNWIIH